MKKIREILLIPLCVLLLSGSLNAAAADGAPIAENLEITTYRGISVGGRLKAFDPEGEEVHFRITTEPKKGTLTLDTQVPISANAAAISKNANYPLSVPLTQSSYSVDTLLTLLHVPSASGACVALAEAVSGSEAAFVSRMNATAQQLGLDAVYYNVHGCGPNKITARSQAKPS